MSSSSFASERPGRTASLSLDLSVIVALLISLSGVEGNSLGGGLPFGRVANLRRSSCTSSDLPKWRATEPINSRSGFNFLPPHRQGERGQLPDKQIDGVEHHS